jgi:hypothetical protein
VSRVGTYSVKQGSVFLVVRARITNNTARKATLNQKDVAIVAPGGAVYKADGAGYFDSSLTSENGCASGCTFTFTLSLGEVSKWDWVFILPKGRAHGSFTFRFHAQRVRFMVT